AHARATAESPVCLRGSRLRPQAAGGVSGNADPAAGGGHDRARDCAANGAHAGGGASQSLPRNEDAARADGRHGSAMNEDYLWDRSGPPDPDVERLEQALAPLRYRHRPELVRPAHSRARIWMAAAAALLLCALATWQAGIRPSPGPTWQIASVEGAAQLG